MDEKTLAYFAGFFDGEGCIQITKRKPYAKMKNPSYTLQVSLHNTHKGVIDKLQDLFGGYVGEHKQKAKDGCARLWQWSLHAKMANAFLDAVSPYLIIKAPEAKIALEFRQEISKRIGISHKGHLKGRMPALRPDELEFREEKRQQLREAKKAYKEYEK